MRWLFIIGAAVLSLALGGCSIARLGYNNAPGLVYYWLDSYFDFDSTQTLALRDKLQALQDWHRKEELPQIADLLKNLQPSATQNVTPEQVCRLYGFVLERAQAPLNYLAPAIANLAVTLSQAQITHIQSEFDKRNQQWRDEWLDVKPAKRLERRRTQIKEQAEMFYGPLNATQTALITSLLEAAGYDPQRQYGEMLRRQQDSIAVLSQIRSSNMAGPQATTEIRNLLARSFASPNPDYRQYAEQARQLGCAAAAQIHNSASAGQREKMLKNLVAYEADARALMAVK